MERNDFMAHRWYYRLEGETPVPIGFEEWMAWSKANPGPQRVAQDQIGKTYWVSTVFLGIDHGFGEGPPRLFETMVFRGGETVDGARYSTWEEAEAGHRKLVQEYQVQQLRD
jgi:hypothetical protein